MCLFENENKSEGETRCPLLKNKVLPLQPPPSDSLEAALDAADVVRCQLCIFFDVSRGDSGVKL
jgi:hypothetical protein